MTVLLWIVCAIIGFIPLLAASYILIKGSEWYWEGKKPWKNWRI